ncbi:MAG: flavin reductase family protein [Pygmaiobacter sp.]
MAFLEITPEELSVNPFRLIGKEWMLLTAGDTVHCNTMTAAWGGLGVLWNKPVTFTFIRPQRYTKEFVDAADSFSLCFFDAEYRKTLSYLGSVSGRDEDKISKAALTTCYEDGIPYFAQANLVLFCKKLYRQGLSPDCMLDASIDAVCYPKQDYHDLYVGEILRVLMRT